MPDKTKRLTVERYEDDAYVKLPNGVLLHQGSRVRVPRDLIWHPEVTAAAEAHGWELGADHSPGSEVLYWPPDAR